MLHAEHCVGALLVHTVDQLDIVQLVFRKKKWKNVESYRLDNIPRHSGIYKRQKDATNSSLDYVPKIFGLDQDGFTYTLQNSSEISEYSQAHILQSFLYAQ